MSEQEARRANTGFWVLIAVLLAVIVFGVVFSQRFGSDPDLTPSPLIGTAMPGLTAPYLEFEGEFDFADLEGSIAVVNFWASWCLGCRVEHASLNDAAAAFADFDVQFIGVLHQDNEPNGIAFLDELGRGEPYTYVVDDKSRIGLEYGVLGLPETFLIDADGIIVGKISGPIGDGQLLANAINDLILGNEIGTIRTGDVENAPG